MSSRLSERLARDGTLPPETIRAALGRQIVYGGSLDTALLEMGALDESALWGELSQSSGLPIPDPALVEGGDPSLGETFDLDRSARCRAVPVARHGDTLQLLCGEPIEGRALQETSAELGLDLELFIVPEVRLRAARQLVYGQAMPARFLLLLARLVGVEPVRRWAEAHATAAQAARAAAPRAEAAAGPPVWPVEPVIVPVEAPIPPAIDPIAAAPAMAPEPPAAPVAIASVQPIVTARLFAPARDGAPLTAVSFAAAAAPSPPAAAPASILARPEPEVVAPPPPLPATVDLLDNLCQVACDPRGGAGRLDALRALRGRLEHPRVRELAAGFRQQAGAGGATADLLRAVTGIVELRDPQGVPALIGLIRSDDLELADAARKGLVEITLQNFGAGRRRWIAWWGAHGQEPRIDWLFEGLSHKIPEIRFAASEELWQTTGEYFGYHFDLPRREREEARGRWRAWWDQNGARRG